MNIDFFGIGILCVISIYFMLPAYLSNISGLIFGGGTPLDFGHKTKEGHDIIGKGCTWRGLIAGTIVGTIVGGLQGIYTPTLIQLSYGIIPLITYNGLYQGLLIGFLLGLGALLGDAGGSFIKRRINIQQGEPAPILDQLDFVFGALIISAFAIRLDWQVIITICILTLFLHLFTNMIAYLIGAKDVWY